MSRILFLSVVLTVLPVAASAQQAQVLAPDESSAPAAPSAVPLSKPLASEPEHRSLALTTLGAVAGAGFGLAMASAFSEDLCVAGETGCSALLLSVYGGFITRWGHRRRRKRQGANLRGGRRGWARSLAELLR